MPKGTTLNCKSFGEAILLPQCGYLAQKQPKMAKNAPIFGKTGPEGPELGKFVFFWVFCLIGPK